MIRPRIIPCLLLRNGGLYKSVKFRDYIYIGDPLNAVRIFNDKGADELLIFDIDATVNSRSPDFDAIERLAGECFMPFCYGGGIQNLDHVRELMYRGAEKVSICSHAVKDPHFVQEAADMFGNQSVVVCIDIKKSLFGSYQVVTHNGRKRTNIDPVQFALEMESRGAGELIINNVNRDGVMTGYDVAFMKKISSCVGIPVIASGGAGSLNDIRNAFQYSGVSACSASSIFVFYGKHRAVLINYPYQDEIERVLNPLIESEIQ